MRTEDCLQATSRNCFLQQNHSRNYTQNCLNNGKTAIMKKYHEYKWKMSQKKYKTMNLLGKCTKRRYFKEKDQVCGKAKGRMWQWSNQTHGWISNMKGWQVATWIRLTGKLEKQVGHIGPETLLSRVCHVQCFNLFSFQHLAIGTLHRNDKLSKFFWTLSRSWYSGNAPHNRAQLEVDDDDGLARLFICCPDLATSWCTPGMPRSLRFTIKEVRD